MHPLPPLGGRAKVSRNDFVFPLCLLQEDFVVLVLFGSGRTRAMRDIKKLVWVIAVILAGAGGVVLIQRQRALAADRELATLVPQITSITIYDVQGDGVSSPLTSTPSAAFPIDIFARSAASASSSGGVTIWKGSSLAVITLRDGTQRRGRFSYYGGFFTLDGVSRRFTIRGEAASEFQQSLNSLIQEQFVPKRHERNGMPNKITGANAGGPPRQRVRTLWAARIAQFCR